MNNQFLKLLTIFGIFSLGIFLTSCDKEDQIFTESIDNYTDGVVSDLQDSSRCGRHGCFEFVFPVTIDFPDGSSVSVEDYAEMRDNIKAYREANPDSAERPTLGFPLEVVDGEGNIISVSSQDELRELRRTCRRSRIRDRRRGHFCFKLVFPLSLEFPDDSVVEVADRSEFKEEIRAWKTANPDSTERPALAFPLSVEDNDGNQTEVGSKEELDALKESCRNDG